MSSIQILNLMGSIIAMMFFVRTLYMAYQTKDYMYKNIAFLFFINSMMFCITDTTINWNKSIFVVMCIFNFAFLIDNAFFEKRRMEKNYKRYWVIGILEKSGVIYKTFKKLSRKEQINILQNTYYYNTIGKVVPIIENKKDEENFECILNKR